MIKLICNIIILSIAVCLICGWVLPEKTYNDIFEKPTVKKDVKKEVKKNVKEVETDSIQFQSENQ